MITYKSMIIKNNKYIPIIIRNDNIKNDNFKLYGHEI